MKDEAYAVHGFRASAVCAGLKKDGGLDLALIYSDKEAVGAGVFTRNRVKAAPVLVSQEHGRQGSYGYQKNGRSCGPSTGCKA